MPHSKLEQALQPLDEPGRVWSTGTFTGRDGRLLFAGVDSPRGVRVFAIGGRREKGETLLEALVREGREEASIDIEAVDAAQTYFTLEGRGPGTIVLPADLAPRPALVWTGPIEAAGRTFNYACAAWKSTFTGDPQPAAEVDHLVWIDQDHIIENRWSSAAPVNHDKALPGPPEPVGTASRASLWLRSMDAQEDPTLRGALDMALSLLRRYRTPEGIIQHSVKVTQVALALGRRLVARGYEIDLEALLLASMCHDIGKADEAVERLDDISDHAEASAEILRREGLDYVSGPVNAHLLSRILDGELGTDLPSRVLFYADKVVRREYVGVDDRLNELARRWKQQRDTFLAARAPLHQLQRDLAAKCGMTVRDLERLCYLGALSEKPDLARKI